jgi:murein DD-endopeptidase MepM/ murein hydrolase activator NlpD
MIAKESSWGSRVFLDIRISFCTAGRSRQLALSPPLQLAALAALLAAGGSLAYLGAGRFADDRAVAAKEAAAVRAESANADLQNDLAQLQDKLVATSRERAEAESRLAGFADQAARLRGLLVDAQGKLDDLEKKRDELLQENARMQQSTAADTAPPNAGRIAELSRALGEAQQDLHQAEAQRATLTARLSKTEADRAGEQARYARYQASLEETAKQLQQIKAERDRLRARIGELEQKLSERRAGRGKSMAGLGGFERALAAAGINVARLLPRFRPDRAEGGPFVPPPKGGQATGGLSSDQLAAMRSLAKSLPLAMPVDHYQIGSDFGSRRDPFNGRRSFHTGLDLDAPYDTPVYSTAPGTIVFAGYRGDYGKVVEIDHGNGVETRYAHLHRFAVSPGQRVEGHARIGYLGSTGRSSGPHVHYEVLVNGEAQDPEKFIGLARLLPGRDS